MRKIPATVVMLATALVTAHATTFENCELNFSSCPETFNNDTIDAPMNIMAVTSQIKMCALRVSAVGDSVRPASVFIIIDHSGSMANSWADPTGSRFTVASQLVQEISAMSPTTEVGVAVFGQTLAWDQTANPTFRSVSTFTPEQQKQYGGYLPLLRLDRKYDEGLGAEIIRKALAIGPEGDQKKNAMLANYPKMAMLREGTNINLAMEAARDAFKSTATSPDRQFVVFLSDGAASDAFPYADRSEYVKGTSMPTTFTIWFGDSPHTSLVSMTDSIRGNGYSSNNPKSNLWAITTPKTELLQLLQTQVLKTIFVGSASAVRGVVQGQPSVGATSEYVLFSNRFPLTGATTNFSMEFDYSYFDSLRQVRVDSTMSVKMSIRRTATNEMPLGVERRCFTQKLDAFYNGAPITTVNATMNEIEGRLEPGFALTGSTTPVTVGLAHGTDRVTLPLEAVAGGSTFARSFSRATGSAVAGDDILQHDTRDSIIITWQNPDLPLNILRITLPFGYLKIDRPYANGPSPAARKPEAGTVQADTVFSGVLQGITLSTDTVGDTIWYSLSRSGTAPLVGVSALRYDPAKGLGQIADDTTMLVAVATRAGYLSSDTLKVRFIREYRRTAALSAFYTDQDADGRIDRISIVLADRLLDIKSMSAHPERIELFEGVRYVSMALSATSDTLHLTVHQTGAQFVSGSQNVSVGAPPAEDGYLAAATLTAEDRAAPVIAGARYRVMGGYRSTIGDSLIVEFTEPVESVGASQNGDRPFILINRGDDYLLVVRLVRQDSPSTMSFAVTQILAGPLYPSLGDSIWLATPGAVRDAFGNTQNNPANIRRLLRVEYPVPIFSASAITPFTPDETRIPVSIPGSSVHFGTVVVLNSRNAIDSALVRIRSVDVKILDAVGNVVIGGLQHFRTGTTVYCPWDGRNRGGRLVGSGTYLAVVTVELEGGPRYAGRVLIGVKR